MQREREFLGSQRGFEQNKRVGFFGSLVWWFWLVGFFGMAECPFLAVPVE